MQRHERGARRVDWTERRRVQRDHETRLNEIRVDAIGFFERARIVAVVVAGEREREHRIQQTRSRRVTRPSRHRARNRACCVRRRGDRRAPQFPSQDGRTKMDFLPNAHRPHRRHAMLARDHPRDLAGDAARHRRIERHARRVRRRRGHASIFHRLARFDEHPHGTRVGERVTFDHATHTRHRRRPIKLKTRGRRPANSRFVVRARVDERRGADAKSERFVSRRVDFPRPIVASTRPVNANESFKSFVFGERFHFQSRPRFERNAIRRVVELDGEIAIRPQRFHGKRQFRQTASSRRARCAPTRKAGSENIPQ